MYALSPVDKIFILKVHLHQRINLCSLIFSYLSHRFIVFILFNSIYILSDNQSRVRIIFFPAEPFIAAGAAVAVIRCFLLFFKGAHGLVVPPRHGSFLPVRTDSSGRAIEKGKAPALVFNTSYRHKKVSSSTILFNSLFKIIAF